MNNPIKISIITPAYNAEQYIENCIKAIIDSDYDLNNIEHIIVDDGSNDNTRQICENWASKFKHIKFYSKPNGNWGSVINYVKHNKLVSGDYTIVCDSDDMVRKEAFKLVNQNKGSDMIIGNYHYFDGTNIGRYCKTILRPLKKTFNKKYADECLNPWLLPHCVYFKTQLFYQIQDLQTGLNYQDGCLFAQIQLLSRTITYLHRSVSLYWNSRVGNTATSALTPKGIQSMITLLKFYEDNQIYDLFVLYVAFCDNGRISSLLKSNIKFTFRNKKMNWKLWPLYMKLHIKILFKKKVKQFLK